MEFLNMFIIYVIYWYWHTWIITASLRWSFSIPSLHPLHFDLPLLAYSARYRDSSISMVIIFIKKLRPFANCTLNYRNTTSNKILSMKLQVNCVLFRKLLFHMLAISCNVRYNLSVVRNHDEMWKCHDNGVQTDDWRWRRTHEKWVQDKTEKKTDRRA